MTREPLPERRRCENFDFVIGNVHYTAGLGFYDDGRLGEIFLTGPKAGTDVEIIAKDAAVMASIALQHGASADVLRHGLQRDAKGASLSPIGTVLDILAGVNGP